MKLKSLFSALLLGAASVSFLTGCGGSGNSGQSSVARTAEPLPTLPPAVESVAFEQHLQLPLAPNQRTQLSNEIEIQVSATELSGRAGEPIYRVMVEAGADAPSLSTLTLWISSTPAAIQLYRYRFQTPTGDTGTVVLSLPLLLNRSAGAENVQRISVETQNTGALNTEPQELRYTLNTSENQWLEGTSPHPIPADRIALRLLTGPVDGTAPATVDPITNDPITVDLAMTTGLGITALMATQGDISLGGLWQARWGAPDPVWLSQTTTGDLAFADSSDWMATNVAGTQMPLTTEEWSLRWQPTELDWLLASTDQVTQRYRLALMTDSANLPAAGAYPLVFTDQTGNSTTTSVIVLPDETSPTME